MYLNGRSSATISLAQAISKRTAVCSPPGRHSPVHLEISLTPGEKTGAQRDSIYLLNAQISIERKQNTLPNYPMRVIVYPRLTNNYRKKNKKKNTLPKFRTLKKFVLRISSQYKPLSLAVPNPPLTRTHTEAFLL